MSKFKIPTNSKEPVSITKSVRFPTMVVQQVEEAIHGTDCTFTAFVVEAVRVALEDLAEDEAENEEQQVHKGRE